jgi:hypothetical protein
MELDGEEVAVFPVYDMRIQRIDTILQTIEVAGHQLLLDFEFFYMRNLFALHGQVVLCDEAEFSQIHTMRVQIISGPSLGKSLSRYRVPRS